MTTLFPLPCPTLPDFTTLLVAGPLHASAPIHLCLSHLAVRPGSTAVLISPSRQNFLDALVDLNDDWLNECGGFGAVSSLLSQVTSLYPPTPLHLSVVLSMLKVAEQTDEPTFTAKAPTASPPALIVLNELSTYFIGDDPNVTLSSYLGMVTLALETIASFGVPMTALALVDSRLNALKLPLVEGPGDGGRAYVPRLALELIELYFEWKAQIEEDDGPNEGRQRSRTLTVSQIGAQAQEPMVWRWIEADAWRRGFSERIGTTFLWPDDTNVP